MAALATEPTYPTISPGELRVFLDTAVKAPTTVGDGYAMHGFLTRIVTLANQSHPIGAVVPVSRPESDLSGEAPTSPSA